MRQLRLAWNGRDNPSSLFRNSGAFQLPWFLVTLKSGKPVQFIENFACREEMSLRWFKEAMSDSPFGEPIFSYSRKQAIEDGILVDLTQFAEIKELWKHHMACTDTVWAIIEAAIRDDGKDLPGILWDISHMAMAATRIQGAQVDTVNFKVIIGRQTHEFKLHVGPGDDPTPVLTLMLRTED